MQTCVSNNSKLKKYGSLVSDNVKEKNTTEYHKLLLQNLANTKFFTIKTQINFRFVQPSIGNQHLLLIVNGEKLFKPPSKPDRNCAYGYLERKKNRERFPNNKEEIEELLDALNNAISIISNSFKTNIFTLDKEYMIILGREGIADVHLCLLSSHNRVFIIPQKYGVNLIESIEEQVGHRWGQMINNRKRNFIHTVQIVENYSFSNVPKSIYYKLCEFIYTVARDVIPNGKNKSVFQTVFSLFVHISDQLYLLLGSSEPDLLAYFHKISDIDDLIKIMEFDLMSVDIQEIKMKKLQRRRVKLSVVGEGRHGKTCLIRALSGKPFKITLSTQSVDRKEFRFSFSPNLLQIRNDFHWIKINEDHMQKSVMGSIILNFYDPGKGIKDVTCIAKKKNIVPHHDTLDVITPGILDENFPNQKQNIISIKIEQEIELANEQVITTEKRQKEKNFMNKITKFARESEEGMIYVNVWDFAGQETYFSSHRFLITESHSVFLLVVNLKEWSKEETIKKTHWWYKSIQQHSPHVIVVATHADCLTDSELLKSMRSLRGAIKSPLAFCLVNLPAEISGSFYYDNWQKRYLQKKLEEISEKDEWKMGIEETRKYLTEQLHNQLDKEELPAVWLYYEHEILELSKIKPVIERSELKSLGKNCYLEEEECNDALKYFSDLGTILLYEKLNDRGAEKKSAEGLENMVVINSHWLIECFKAIVIRSDLDNVQNTLDEKTKELLKEGIITREFIQHRYNTQKILQLCDVDTIINLLHYYRIIYTHENQPEYFHAPHLMPEKELSFEFDMNNGSNNSLVELKYFPKLISMGTMTDLIVCSSKWTTKIEKNHHPWRNGVWWQTNEHYDKVKMIPENDSVEITVYGPNSFEEATLVMKRLQEEIFCPSILLNANEESVDEALCNLISRLKIPDDYHSNISKIIKKIKKSLETSISVSHQIKESGSYKRGTSLFPINDIDLIVVLDDSFRTENSPEFVIEKLSDEIDKMKVKSYKKIRAKRQTRSVGFEMIPKNRINNPKKISFDIVPAFVKECEILGRVLEIPDCKRKIWITTNPENHEMILNSCVKLKEIVKFVKKWLLQQKKLFLKQNNKKAAKIYKVKSFNVEAMLLSCHDLVNFLNNTEKPSYKFALEITFRYLRQSVLKPLIPPDGLIVTEIPETVDAKELKNEAFTQVYNLIRKANKAHEEGKYRTALRLWKSIFLDLY